MKIPTIQSPRVAVIGFGPAGMFFCHHVEQRRRQLLAQTDELQHEALAKLPQVTCFEKEGGPGGNWRADKVTSESLWTNGPKEVLEFYDYTFADHYGPQTKLPCYLTRAATFDYMMARVTRDAPDFVERYAKFHTQVTHVSYCSATQQFTIVHQDLNTGIESVGMFDKCIWAAGDYGVPRIPATLTKALEHFDNGPILHSSELGLKDFKTHAKDKHILLVGGSYSAEDIALTAIKHGAECITIVIRHADHTVPVLWPYEWLQDKVDIVMGKVPIGVNKETQAIQCVAWDIETDQPDLTSPVEEIEEVDTIILCTGFDSCHSMINAQQLGIDFPKEQYEKENCVDLPPDWEMPPNDLSEHLGDVPVPSNQFQVSNLFSLHNFHGCVSTLNPNFMVADSSHYDTHILAIDIFTKVMLSCIMGETTVPTKDELVARNRAFALEGMEIPYVRFWVDPNYRKAMRRLYVDRDGEIPAEWSNYMKYSNFYFRLLAQAAKDGHYATDFGDGTKLNSVGLALVNMDAYSRNYNEESNLMATFRDLDPKCCAQLKSIYTGNAAAPFKVPWMKLDDMASPADMVSQTLPQNHVGARNV